jgi:hypothetical protein
MYIVSTNQVVCMITHIRSGLININYRSTRINDPVGPMSCVFLQLLFQVPQKKIICLHTLGMFGRETIVYEKEIPRDLLPASACA